MTLRIGPPHYYLIEKHPCHSTIGHQSLSLWRWLELLCVLRIVRIAACSVKSLMYDIHEREEMVNKGTRFRLLGIVVREFAP